MNGPCNAPRGPQLEGASEMRVRVFGAVVAILISIACVLASVDSNSDSLPPSEDPSATNAHGQH